MAHRLRRLTANEIGLLRPVFADRIRYDRVRLSDGHGLSIIAAIALRQPHAAAITLRNTIYFGSHYAADFAAAKPGLQSLLVHEMTHVRQWAELGMTAFLARYLREFAACGRDAKAMYLYKPGEPFASARLEAQAQMVQDYYLASAFGKPRDDLAAGLASSGTYGL